MDIVRQTSEIAKVTTIKVTGTAKSTRIQAVDEDQNLFIDATMKVPVPEFEGVFGISNLGMLNKLLGFASYRADGASQEMKRRAQGATDAPYQIVFKDPKGAGSIFQLMNADLVPQQADIKNIPWDVTITPEKPKIAEFRQLSAIFSEVDKMVRIRTEGDRLIFCVGEENSSTNSATMVFAEGITGEIKGDLFWPIDPVLSLFKVAGTNPLTFMVTSKGILGTSIETPLGTYAYYFRATKR